MDNITEIQLLHVKMKELHEHVRDLIAQYEMEEEYTMCFRLLKYQKLLEVKLQNREIE